MRCWRISTIILFLLASLWFVSAPALATPPGPCTITGTDGNDVLYGTAGNDVICGGKGNDILWGQEGDDQFLGGDGNDIIHGGPGCDQLHSGSGDDTLYGDSGVDKGCLDRLNGDTGNDILYGGTGQDDLNGGPGFNDLYGGAGTRDWVDYSCHVGPVVATFGGTGTDPVLKTVDTLHTDIENMIGGMGNDVLTGTDNDNQLNGGPGGNDVINGMGGADILKGGYWETTSKNCAYRPTNTNGDADVFNGGTGTDTVTYAGRGPSIIAVIGGGPVSGDPTLGEKDTISLDVEKIIGAKAKARLSAAPRALPSG